MDPAFGRCQANQSAWASKKLVQPIQVLADDLQVALGNGIGVPQRQGGQKLAGGAGTNGGVILERGHLLEKRVVMGGDPADAQTGQAVGFGHHPQRHRPCVHVGHGRQAVGRIQLQAPVDFVRKNDKAVPFGKRRQFMYKIAVRQKAGGIVGQIDHDHFRAIRESSFQIVEIDAPPVVRFCPPLGHLGTDSASHVAEGLVAGRMNDEMVPGLQGDIHEVEDGLFGTCMHQHLFGGDPFIKGGDGLPQLRMTQGFRVTEPKRGKLIAGVGLHCQQFLQRHAFAVRGTENIRGRELMFGEIAFQTKGFQLHVAVLLFAGCPSLAKISGAKMTGWQTLVGRIR